MNRLAHILVYLDPGTGSIIIQLVIAAVTGAFFFFKKVRLFFIDLFNKLRNKKPDDRE